MGGFGSVERFTDKKCGPQCTGLFEKPVDPYAQYHNDPTKHEEPRKSYEEQKTNQQERQGFIMSNLLTDREELQTLVKDFFEKFLDTWEESDSGKEFHPITISCCRAMKIEPLDNLLNRMRELSGAKPAYEIGGEE